MARLAPRALLAPLSAALLAACGSDPVSYSAPVGLSLDARSGDVVGGSISADKNVNTESGNPYGAFVNGAVQALGRAPSRIAVTSATLELESSSTGVASLQEVFAGTVTLGFVMNGSSTVYPVASVASPTGAGPVALSVSFDSGSMPPADYADLAGGSFKVELDGGAAPGFAAAAATARMTATLGFVAYE
jgi:hypothetical protein